MQPGLPVGTPQPGPLALVSRACYTSHLLIRPPYRGRAARCSAGSAVCFALDSCGCSPIPVALGDAPPAAEPPAAKAQNWPGAHQDPEGQRDRVPKEKQVLGWPEAASVLGFHGRKT